MRKTVYLVSSYHLGGDFVGDSFLRLHDILKIRLAVIEAIALSVEGEISYFGDSITKVIAEESNALIGALEKACNSSIEEEKMGLEIAPKFLAFLWSDEAIIENNRYVLFEDSHSTELMNLVNLFAYLRATGVNISVLPTENTQYRTKNINERDTDVAHNIAQLGTNQNILHMGSHHVMRELDNPQFQCYRVMVDYPAIVFGERGKIGLRSDYEQIPFVVSANLPLRCNNAMNAAINRLQQDPNINIELTVQYT